MRKALSCDRGFTLIEALVALAIGGFVIAMLATITGQWLRQWRHGAAALSRSEMLITGLDRVVADLSAARFMPSRADGTGSLFVGDDTAVAFVRRALPVERPGGLEIVRLGARSAGSDATLVRSRSPIVFGTFPTAPSDNSPVVLLRAPYAVRFAYADQDGRWRASWRDERRIPQLIRVDVVDRRSGASVLVPVVVRVHVDAPMACARPVTTTQFCDTVMGLGPAPAPGPAADDGRPGAAPANGTP